MWTQRHTYNGKQMMQTMQMVNQAYSFKKGDEIFCLKCQGGWILTHFFCYWRDTLSFQNIFLFLLHLKFTASIYNGSAHFRPILNIFFGSWLVLICLEGLCTIAVWDIRPWHWALFPLGYGVFDGNCLWFVYVQPPNGTLITVGVIGRIEPVYKHKVKTTSQPWFTDKLPQAGRICCW